MISITHLNNNWDGIFSLKDISLDIKKGEYFVVLGPSGSGKTLLLELIAGIHIPDSGRIDIGKKDVTTESPEHRNVGFLYQDYNLFPHYNVRKNIEYGLRVRKMSKEFIDSRIKELVDIIGIEHLMDRDVKTLSGGEQQKVGLARALAYRPDVILLDEPFSSLDENTKYALIHEMKDIHSREKATIIHVTHSQEESMLLADRIGIMMEGRIVQVGTPEEIFYKPTSVDVARFVKIENVWEAKVITRNEETMLLRIGDKELVAPPIKVQKGSEVRVIIRPEDIILGHGQVTSARNAFSGKVVSLEQCGFYYMVRIDCGFPVVAAITRRSVGSLGLEPGKDIDVLFKTTALHVIEK